MSMIQEGERHQRLIREVDEFCNDAAEQITLVSASMVAPDATTVTCSSGPLHLPSSSLPLPSNIVMSLEKVSQ